MNVERIAGSQPPQITPRRFYLLTALLGFFILFIVTAFTRGATASRALLALRRYRQAFRMRVTLESRPEPLRTTLGYERVIHAFRQVFITDPASPRAPEALAAVAALYEEMGRRFANDRYDLKSIQWFQFLIRNYPHDPVARDAMFTVGEIYRTDLQDPEDARQAFEQVMASYPHTYQAREAQVKISRIDRRLAAWAKRNARTAPVETPNRRSAGSIPEVTGIRDWVGPNYTRVVISVEAPVRFTSARLTQPDRIFFDLENARLSPELEGQTFPVENRFLQQIRIAQFKPTVTRVVLDVQRFRDYTVFSLPNPFRLVIDIHGPQPPTLLAKRAAPPAPAHATTHPYKAELKRPGLSASPNTRPSAPETSKTSETSNPPETATVGHRETPSTRRVEASAPVVPRSIQAAMPLAGGSRTLSRALGLKIDRIVIDPGHGGYDTGTIGPAGLEEKNIVLDVALRLRKLLEQRTNLRVYMTRKTDVFIPLEERTAIANEKDADLFISIHANASRDPEARGIETYYLNFTSDPEALAQAARENATSQASVHQLQSIIKEIALSDKINESREFASDVQHAMVRDLARDGDPEPNRGVKKAPFVVLIGANMPSILCEISFLTNPHDNYEFHHAAFREDIAKALASGIIRYLREIDGVSVAQRGSAHARQ